MQRAKKIGYVVALVFAGSAMGGISAAQSPQPDDSPPQDETPPRHDMPQKDMPSQNDMPKDMPQQKDQAQQKSSSPTEVMAEKLSTTATVMKVNMAKRQLTLKDDQGHQFKLDIPEKISGFNAIKKGDKISADYYSSVALSLKKGAGTAPSATIGTAEERVPGPLPGGVVAHTVRSTVEVVNVDKSANKLTVKMPSGDMDTIDIKDAGMQSDLDKIKKGDKIKASYTEAVAIEVTPQEKPTKQPT